MAVFLTALSWLAAASPASANLGYELDGAHPSRALGAGYGPHGVAVDQANGQIYIAVITTSVYTGAPGLIARFNSDLSEAGTFKTGSGYYTGVAVDPTTGGFFAAQAHVRASGLSLGTSQMDTFSSSGTVGSSFALSDVTTYPQIAADSNGLVYFPNEVTHTVQALTSSGVVEEEISCSGCPGGSSFGRPVSVAIDSADNLYVVDLAPDRVVKLSPSAGGYVYDSTLQSGKGAGAVGVDPSDDTVFVGDLPGGVNYHIDAYDSSGVQFDDFGSGLFPDPEPEFGALIAAQMAADGSSHRLYVGAQEGFYVFDRVTPHAPTAAILSASTIGQVSASLRASVNPRGHTAIECRFEYVDDVDFQATGFEAATSVPCAETPIGSTATTITTTVKGLTPAAVYHYRQTTTTYAGSVTTSAQTLETLPSTSPTVVTEPAKSLETDTATLTGTANPHGGEVTGCYFEYGTGTAYGKKAPCPTPFGTVTVDVAQSAKVGGLTSATPYHYRLVVTSNAGVAHGGDVSFVTLSPPPPPVEEDPPSAEPESTAAQPAPSPAVTGAPVVQAPPAKRRVSCGKGRRRRRIGGKVRCVRMCRKVARKRGGRKVVRGVLCRKKRHRKRHVRRGAHHGRR